MVHDDLPAAALAQRIQDRSAKGIASEIAQLINLGELPTGTRLPSVRALANELRVSPATVSAAWSTLKRFGSVESHGRAGTRVIGHAAPHPRRYASEGEFDHRQGLDLSLSVPDPTLLPDMSRYLDPSGVEELHEYRRAPILPALLEAIEACWPYPGESFLAVNSGYEGLKIAIGAFLRPGDNVVVEEPSPPRILDALEHAGCRPIGVRRDGEGLRPDQLERLLARKPTALLLQPGLHNPEGTAMSPARAETISRLLDGHDIVTIEDDGLGFLSPTPAASLAERRPGERHVLIRSFSKSHGPDLRLAVVEGTTREVQQMHAYSEFGARWTSRILQDALAQMLTDDAAWQQLRDAQREYAARRARFVDRYDLAGALRGDNLLDAWLRVSDERRAVVTLAAHGMACLGARKFFLSDPPELIRISTSRVTEEHWPTLDHAMARVEFARAKDTA